MSFTFMTEAQSIKRDIRNYQAGAVFDLHGEFFGKAEDAKQSLRKYFWDVWNSKTQSYFKVFTYTREGDRVSCTYYVENTKDNRRQIVEECASSQCPYASKKACRNKKPTITMYDQVEKVNQEPVLADGQRISTNETVIVLSNSKSNHKNEF